jgi:hypothetical protein
VKKRKMKKISNKELVSKPVLARPRKEERRERKSDP